MGFSVYDTKKLTLIPVSWVSKYGNYGCIGTSGIEFVEDYISPANIYCRPFSANGYIVFGFKGSIVGILLRHRQGNIDVYIDNVLVLDNFSTLGIKGPEYLCSYIIKDDLSDDYHEIKIVAKDTDLQLIGILVDSRVNYHLSFDYPDSRYLDGEELTNQSVGNNYESTEFNTLPYRFIGLGFVVSGATTIEVYGKIYNNYFLIGTLSFSGAGSDSLIIWANIYSKIKFKVITATTLSFYMSRRL
jgi:hypothetical protein